jgi:hypothetical protein
MSIRNLNPGKQTYRAFLESPIEKRQKPLETSGGLMQSLQRSMQSKETKELGPKEKAIGIFQAIHEARMRHKNGRTA